MTDEPRLNSAQLQADGEMLEAMRTAALEAARLLRAIGSPHRLMILCLLTKGENTVTEIADVLGVRQSLASQHLTHLRLNGLVEVQRRGHFAYYSLSHTVAREIVEILYEHFCVQGQGQRDQPLPSL